MLEDFKAIFKELSKPSDYVIVGGAALAGFVLDTAINIAPLPAFSPGVCGVTAAGTALVAKRGWEARKSRQRDDKLWPQYVAEAERQLALLEDSGPKFRNQAADLQFDLDVAIKTRDLKLVQQVIEKARKLLWQ